MNIVKERKQSKAELLDLRLQQLRAKMKLDGWNQLVEEVSGPPEVIGALTTGRPELVRTAPARPLTAEECKALYKLIAVLVETNAALQEHAEEVSKLVKHWAEAFTALDSLGRQVEHFAAFRTIDETGDDDDEHCASNAHDRTPNKG